MDSSRSGFPRDTGQSGGSSTPSHPRCRRRGTKATPARVSGNGVPGPTSRRARLPTGAIWAFRCHWRAFLRTSRMKLSWTKQTTSRRRVLSSPSLRTCYRSSIPRGICSPRHLRRAWLCPHAPKRLRARDLEVVPLVSVPESTLPPRTRGRRGWPRYLTQSPKHGFARPRLASCPYSSTERRPRYVKPDTFTTILILLLMFIAPVHRRTKSALGLTTVLLQVWEAELTEQQVP